jgi:hypothetical protein
MRIKIFMTVLAVLLVFSATAQVALAQKDGEAQVVSFDKNNWTTIKFSNKDDKPDCRLFISYLLTEKQEEAFAIRAAHLHRSALGRQHSKTCKNFTTDSGRGEQAGSPLQLQSQRLGLLASLRLSLLQS